MLNKFKKISLLKSATFSSENIRDFPEKALLQSLLRAVQKYKAMW